MLTTILLKPQHVSVIKYDLHGVYCYDSFNLKNVFLKNHFNFWY
jgi:hypothetical protein